MWNGEFWAKTSLLELGLVFQLGHGGNACPAFEDMSSPVVSCTPMEFIMSLYAIADADTPVKMLESTAISSYVCLGSLRLLSVLVLHAPSQCSTCSMSCPFRGRCPVTTFTTA